ncbi:MAG TPA: VWA domain-containing protein [Pyrinomonadaceae bacterium]|nr:VWA domain-containing protein [Pyrinomonadaceae bacterium]
MKRVYFFAFLALISLSVASEFLPSAWAQQASPVAGSKAGATPTPTPKPGPTIREEDIVETVETELVNLNVRVVDRNNRPINNVQESEFKIFEDNVPQKIEFFSKSEVPTSYSLVIDNSGSLRSQIDEVIEASKILVAANKPEDETSVIRFVSSDKIEILQDFTGNKTDLNDALDNLYIEGGQTAIIDAIYLAAGKVTDRDKGDNKVDRKRRALILVSDGEDVSSYYSQQQLFDLLRETDVQIYVVGFVKDLSSEKGFITKSKQGKAKAFLEKLASETGGKAYFPEAVSQLNGIARDIASELRTQYSIGYLPSNDREDGTYRNIKVTVADGPSSQKRIALTRTGRTASGATTPSAPTKKSN